MFPPLHDKSHLSFFGDEKSNSTILREKIQCDNIDTSKTRVFEKDGQSSRRLSRWRPFSQRSIGSSSISPSPDNDIKDRRKRLGKSFSSRSASYQGPRSLFHSHELEHLSEVSKDDIIDVKQVFGVQKSETKKLSKTKKPIAGRLSELKSASWRSLQSEACATRSARPFVESATNCQRLEEKLRELEMESKRDKETIRRLASALIRMKASLKEEVYNRKKIVEKLQEENHSMSITLNNLMSNENKLIISLRHQDDDHTRELQKEIKELRSQIECKDAIIASLKKCLEQLRQSLTRPRRQDKQLTC